MQRKKPLSMVTQIVLRTMIMFIVVIVILTMLTMNLFYDSLKERIMKDQKQTVDYITENMEQTFYNFMLPMITLSKEPAAKRLLADRNQKYTSAWMEDIRQLDILLNNTNMFNNYIVDIALIQTDSMLVYSLTDQFRYGYEYVDQPWFRDAVAKEGLIKYACPQDHSYIRNSQSPYLLTAIYPIRGSAVQGYVMLEVDLTRIAQTFKGMSSHADLSYWITSEDGEIIFDYENKRHIKEKDLMDKITNHSKDGTYVQNNQFYTIHKMDVVPWYVIGESNYKIIIKPVVQILQIIIWLTVGAIAAFLLLMVILSKNIKKPLDQLLLRIENYEGKESIVVAEEKAPKEIVIIREKFERMADRINSLIHDVYLAQMRKREMELEALMNQINPHFLYNVLQLIQTKAVMADDREVEDMITSLGSMLHYTMTQSKGNVTIREEIAYMENYLMFYKARFAAKFEYEIACNESLYDCQTMKFILQPVAENCFTHGIRNRKTGGIVNIRVTEEGEDLLLYVYDNGEGIPPDKLEKLRRELLCSEMDGEEFGIGILNTHARIRLIYGEPYGLTIHSIEGEYTEVCIRIGKTERGCLKNV